MISADTVARQIRRSRHRQRGTITNVTLSDTEVDAMNRPAEVPTVTPVEFLWHPEEGAETNDSRQVGTGRRVVYLPACTSITTTSRLTHAGLDWEVLSVEPWGVGTVARVVRSV